MNKKTIILTLILACFSSLYVSAEVSSGTTAKLQSATIFFQGAELTHKAKVQLVPGSNYIKLDGLSPNVDKASIRVKASNGAIITSSEYSIDYISEQQNSVLIKKLRDSISIYDKELSKIDVDNDINRDILELLRSAISNGILDKEQALSLDQIKGLLNYLEEDSYKRYLRYVELEERKEQINDRVFRLEAQLNAEELKGSRNSGVLFMNITSVRSMSSDLTVNYFTSSASWTPYYDINITSFGEPVDILMKSMVRQTTGFDWNNINITLSTARPSRGDVAPELSPWFLRADLNRAMLMGYANVPVMGVASGVKSEVSYMDDVAAYEKSAPANPLVILDGVPISYEDYQLIDPAMIKETKRISAYEARRKYGDIGTNGALIVSLKSGVEDFVAQADNQLAATYTIDLPYTIPGNGKQQAIDLSRNKIQAEYSYYIAPEMDARAYLIAKIADWQKLNLHSGKANLTYDGTYIGQVAIDASSVKDKLRLTLGVDERVTVRREILQDFTKEQSVGNNTLRTMGYKVTVRNNQSKAIDINVKERYPISTQKDIQVELDNKQITPWTTKDDELGVITWSEKLNVGESKTYQITYSVKYPKNHVINL